jgi:hypothetical protein
MHSVEAMPAYTYNSCLDSIGEHVRAKVLLEHSRVDIDANQCLLHRVGCHGHIHGLVVEAIEELASDRKATHGKSLL